MPTENSIDISGLDVTPDGIKELLAIDKDSWNKEVELIKEYYAKFGDKLPSELAEQLAQLEERLK